MEPLGTCKSIVPIDHAGLDRSDGRIFAVVEHATGAGCRSKFKEIEADTVFGCEEDMRGVDPTFAGVVCNETTQRVVGETTGPGSFTAQTGQTHGSIELGPTHFQVETAGLLQSVKLGGSKANHGFAKSDAIKSHGCLSVLGGLELLKAGLLDDLGMRAAQCQTFIELLTRWNRYNRYKM